MIGRKPERADPFVFVCCTNLSVLKDAEHCIRSSDFKIRFQGFKLGAIALPLESQVPLRRVCKDEEIYGQPQEVADSSLETCINTAMPNLAEYALPAAYERQVTPVNHETIQDLIGAETLEIRVYASNHDSHHTNEHVQDTKVLPKVGARLWYSQDDSVTPYAPQSTGGVILSNGTDLFQLTARYLWDRSIYASPGEPGIATLDYCHFDDQDTDEDDDFELLSQASLSSAETGSPDTASEGQFSPLEFRFETARAEQTHASHVDLQSHLQYLAYPSRTTLSAGRISNDGYKGPGPTEEAEEFSPVLLGVIDSPHDSLPCQALDFSMLRLPDTRSYSSKNPNEFQFDGRTITIHDASEIPSTETEIIAICSSTGPCRGVLIPGAISHRFSNCTATIYQIQMQNAILAGDSGSAVVNATTGEWYGQIVLGCPGTNQAYFSSAVEIMNESNRAMQPGHTFELYGRRHLLAAPQKLKNETDPLLWLERVQEWKNETDPLIWITGRPGTGKEILARSLHTHHLDIPPPATNLRFQESRSLQRAWVWTTQFTRTKRTKLLKHAGPASFPLALWEPLQLLDQAQTSYASVLSTGAMPITQTNATFRHPNTPMYFSQVPLNSDRKLCTTLESTRSIPSLGLSLSQGKELWNDSRTSESSWSRILNVIEVQPTQSADRVFGGHIDSDPMVFYPSIIVVILRPALDTKTISRLAHLADGRLTWRDSVLGDSDSERHDPPPCYQSSSRSLICVEPSRLGRQHIIAPHRVLSERYFYELEKTDTYDKAAVYVADTHFRPMLPQEGHYCSRTHSRDTGQSGDRHSRPNESGDWMWGISIDKHGTIHPMADGDEVAERDHQVRLRALHGVREIPEVPRRLFETYLGAVAQESFHGEVHQIHILDSELMDACGNLGKAPSNSISDCPAYGICLNVLHKCASGVSRAQDNQKLSLKVPYPGWCESTNDTREESAWQRSKSCRSTSFNMCFQLPVAVEASAKSIGL
ncbi:uncharacterized protein B0I36DRAFT_433117 [Microdochium trichocladiopsis]|uniref:Uncharacterized protein n=1 Tax=Microdochium trichocladiopsis TaxID=1682393 RepID=A0A9P8Y148_9PEZI|nr:uncharacterized protein B0I36DRAFT_433117 [Microdochium trichocladiopsis]KAH7027958.1 hypothetical protein B0I36DRAFT_433117 [Microdochium trichocladiopsis]